MTRRSDHGTENAQKTRNELGCSEEEEEEGGRRECERNGGIWVKKKTDSLGRYSPGEAGGRWNNLDGKTLRLCSPATERQREREREKGEKKRSDDAGKEELKSSHGGIISPGGGAGMDGDLLLLDRA